MLAGAAELLVLSPAVVAGAPDVGEGDRLLLLHAEASREATAATATARDALVSGCTPSPPVVDA
jgi:hypothetical protein